MPEAQPLSALEWAILETVAYSDIFDYPLTERELHRYLIGVAATPDAIRAALSGGALARAFLTERDGFFMLSGREHLVEVRRRRAQAAAALWPVALHYGGVIAALPFVRMVAVTGSLAVDNVEPGGDIDYLVVTQPGRLWVCRLFVVAVVRLAARRGHTLCPNYFLAENALAIHDRSLYAARELAQMAPLTAFEVYDRMRRLNAWTAEYLPNAAGLPDRNLTRHATNGRFLQKFSESVLRAPPGAWLERWEMARKIRKFRRQYGESREADFCPDWCKGHYDGHGERTHAAFDARLSALRRQRQAMAEVQGEYTS